MSRFAALAQLFESADADSRPRKICIVTSEILGPSRNGGIGTAMTGLAELLARAGHPVTVLYTDVAGARPRSIEGDFDGWRRRYSAKQIDLRALTPPAASDSNVSLAMAVAEFLAGQSYDFVYFNDYLGHGFFFLNGRSSSPARHPGLACVVTHGGVRWASEHNHWPLHTTDALETNYMERRSVELADVVIGPSRHLLEQYQRWGWRLPALTAVHPYVVPVAEGVRRVGPADPIRELVFFGRLEVRKGLALFCDAMDIIAQEHPGLTVTFMGKFVDIVGESSGSYILRRGRPWKNRIRVLSRMDQAQAVRYVAAGGRLAVLPSLADNSPCVIYECLYAGVRFLASGATGGVELVAPESVPDCTFEPSVDGLVAKLRAALAGELDPPAPAIDRAAIEDEWLRFHRRLPQKPAPRSVHEPAPRRAANFGLLVIDPRDVPVQMIQRLVGQLKDVATGCCQVVVASDRVDADERAALLDHLADLRGEIHVACFFADQLDGLSGVIARVPCDFWGILDAPTMPTRHVLEDIARLADDAAYCAGQVASLDDATIFGRQEAFGPVVAGIGRTLIGPLSGASDATLEIKNTVCAGVFAVRTDLFAAGLERFGLLRPHRGRLHAAADLGFLWALLARSMARGVHVSPSIWATHASWCAPRRDRATWGELFLIARQMEALTSPDLAGFLSTALNMDAARRDREAAVRAEDEPLSALDQLLTSREPVDSDRALAILAQVSADAGRFELAVDLLAQTNFQADEAMRLVPEFAASAVRFGLEQRPIKLMRRLIAGPIAFDGRLREEYFRIEGSNVFLLHPNEPTQPVHTVSIPAVTVRGRERLDVICILADESQASVVFDVGVSILASGSVRSARAELKPGQSAVCRVDLRGIGGDCRVAFSTHPSAGKSNWYARAYFRDPIIY